MDRDMAARIYPILLFLLMATAGGVPSVAADFELGRPLDCDPGKTCWIANYVDLDPAPNATRDYRCGWRTYDTHKGVDFAIRDLAEMEAGVKVRAAAPGVVKGTRDGMADVSFRDLKNASVIAKRECGNGVMVIHEGGWSTQYCHMKKGSVTVKSGQSVAKGEVLGLVGLSGLTEFPHLHMTLRHGNNVIDPFVGLVDDPKCGAETKPLWNAVEMAGFVYGPSLYNAGFAAMAPKEGAARAGLYQDQVLPREAPVLVFWADIFGVEKGDRLEITIDGPNGERFFEHGVDADHDRAQWFVFAGPRKKTLFWDVGNYVGQLTLLRNPGRENESKQSISRTIQLR